MAATTVTSGCKPATFFSFSLPNRSPPKKLYPLPKHHLCSNYDITLPQFSPQSALINTICTRSISSPETSVVVDEEEEEEEAKAETEESGAPPVDVVSAESGSVTSFAGCKACGREEMERGCNGEGRIQGGIATVPGFGWWPIKAYRPCPAYVASGGRYRRTGQSMDEVVSGRSVRDTSYGSDDGAKSRKKKEGPRKFK